VELMQAEVTLAGRPWQLVDLPGIYDLRGHSGDEAVVRRFLETTPVDLMLVVLNASQLDRQLRLALQVQKLGLPALVVLNMADEARRFGVQVDPRALEAALALPVVLASAKYGGGLGTVREALAVALEHSAVTEGPGPIPSPRPVQHARVAPAGH
jgi:ferrous iron transport protein B